jgi:hypothetical protein
MGWLFDELGTSPATVLYAGGLYAIIILAPNDDQFIGRQLL